MKHNTSSTASIVTLNVEQDRLLLDQSAVRASPRFPAASCILASCPDTRAN